MEYSTTNPRESQTSRFVSTMAQPSWILLGHHNEQQRVAIAGFLRREGHQVQASGDGLQLLDWLGDALVRSTVPTPPDLIIMEMDLPGRRGIDLLSDLRSFGWDTPFILLAEPGQAAQIQQAGRFSSTIIFEWPYELADLYTAVILMLEHGAAPSYSAAARVERRAAPRARVQLWAEEVTRRALYLLRLEDLSVGGARVRHSLPRAAGAKLRLRLTLPASQQIARRIEIQPIDIQSEVVSATQDGWEYGLGVRFLGLGTYDQANIAAYVQRRLMAPPPHATSPAVTL